jgi:hypothetical protein
MKKLPDKITGCVKCPYICTTYLGSWGCHLTNRTLTGEDFPNLPEDYISEICPLEDIE